MTVKEYQTYREATGRRNRSGATRTSTARTAGGRRVLQDAQKYADWAGAPPHRGAMGVRRAGQGTAVSVETCRRTRPGAIRRLPRMPSIVTMHEDGLPDNVTTWRATSWSGCSTPSSPISGWQEPISFSTPRRVVRGGASIPVDELIATSARALPRSKLPTVGFGASCPPKTDAGRLLFNRFRRCAIAAQAGPSAPVEEYPYITALRR